MATIASCKFATDVSILADYLTLREQNQNVTLELSSTDHFYILDWGNNFFTHITQFVINFFTRLQQEGWNYYLNAPAIALNDRKVQVFQKDFDTMVNSYDSWMQHLWLEKQRPRAREQSYIQMDTKHRQEHFALYSHFIELTKQMKSEDGREYGNQSQAIYVEFVGFHIVSKLLAKAEAADEEALPPVGEIVLHDEDRVDEEAPVVDGEEEVVDAGAVVDNKNETSMPVEYPKLLAADFPPGALHAGVIVELIETCANRIAAMKEVLGTVKTADISAAKLVDLQQALKGEEPNAATMRIRTMLREGTVPDLLPPAFGNPRKREAPEPVQLIPDPFAVEEPPEDAEALARRQAENRQ